MREKRLREKKLFAAWGGILTFQVFPSFPTCFSTRSTGTFPVVTKVTHFVYITKSLTRNLDVASLLLGLHVYISSKFCLYSCPASFLLALCKNQNGWHMPEISDIFKHILSFYTDCVKWHKKIWKLCSLYFSSWFLIQPFSYFEGSHLFH